MTTNKSYNAMEEKELVEELCKIVSAIGKRGESCVTLALDQLELMTDDPGVDLFWEEMGART
jgi:hypothetical protein